MLDEGYRVTETLKHIQRRHRMDCSEVFGIMRDLPKHTSTRETPSMKPSTLLGFLIRDCFMVGRETNIMPSAMT